MWTAARSIFNLLAGIAVVFGAWQLFAWSEIIPSDYFPGVRQMLEAFVRLVQSGELPSAETLTLTRTVVGLILSCVIGLGLALLGMAVPLMKHALAPLVSIFQVLPPAALVPLSIYFLGFDEHFFLFIICFASCWPIYQAALRALAGTEPLQMASGRSLGYRPLELIWRVRVPASMPELFTGIRIAAGIALVSTVAAEMLASRNGLGFLLFDTAFSLRVDETFAVLVVVAFNGLVVNGLVLGARRLLAGWSLELSASG